MNNIIYNNAYGIIGLLPNSSQKEITRRVKEIEKMLQIEEVPEYPYDFELYNTQRSINNIKNAMQNISYVEKNMMHYFFRIYANNEKQITFLNSINKETSIQDIVNWQDTFKAKNFVDNKNIAIILTLMLLNRNLPNDELLKTADFCINLWCEIINTEKTFKDFKKIFLLNDEIGIDEKYFENIKDNILNELTLIFSDISEIHNNNEILAKFITIFKLNDNVFNIDIVEKIYNAIDSSIKTMDSLNISEDGVFDDNEKAILKNCLQTFQNEFNKLIDLGLYENEKTIILRDLVATKVRIQILDLFNNLSEDETALKLMQFAIYIVGTEGLKDKLEDELSDIKANMSIKELVKPIEKIIKKMEKEAYYLYMNNVEIYVEDIRKKCNAFIQNTQIGKNEKNNILNLISMKLRSLAIDLHNKKEKFKESQYLLNFALELAQTQDIKNLCLKDLMVVNRTVENRCGINGFLNSGIGGCLLKILGYGVIWLIIMGIGALFGG